MAKNDLIDSEQNDDEEALKWAKFEDEVCDFVAAHNSRFEIDSALFNQGYLIDNIYNDDANVFNVGYDDSDRSEDIKLRERLLSQKKLILRIKQKLDSRNFVVPDTTKSAMREYLEILENIVWDTQEKVVEAYKEWDKIAQQVKTFVAASGRLTAAVKLANDNRFKIQQAFLKFRASNQ